MQISELIKEFEELEDVYSWEIRFTVADGTPEGEWSEHYKVTILEDYRADDKSRRFITRWGYDLELVLENAIDAFKHDGLSTLSGPVEL